MNILVVFPEFHGQDISHLMHKFEARQTTDYYIRLSTESLAHFCFYRVRYYHIQICREVKHFYNAAAKISEVGRCHQLIELCRSELVWNLLALCDYQEHFDPKWVL